MFFSKCMVVLKVKDIALIKNRSKYGASQRCDFPTIYTLSKILLKL